MRPQVGIVGGSGYVGGELLRLLLGHAQVELTQVTSRRYAGRFLHLVHPNLRGLSGLKFTEPDSLGEADLLFLALPHGYAADEIERYATMADRIVDCSADFRLRDPADYERWYGQPHPEPEWLPRFMYGLPERHRAELRQSQHASGVGCNAVAVILTLGPLADAGALDRVVVDVKVGSSEAGARPSRSSHHPERRGAVRVYSTSGHRHLAEIEQELGRASISMTVTAIEMVRGVHVNAHCSLNGKSSIRSERDLWHLYREAYADEPFVRLVSGKSGLHRLPEPKTLAGTNFCDVGFSLDEDSGQLLVVGALDNLVKGAAGSAVQTMNLMLGFDEREGLTFPGLHPI